MDAMKEFKREETGSIGANSKYLVTPFHLCLNMKLTYKQRNGFIIEYFFPCTC